VGERPLGCPRRPLGRPLEIYGQHYGAATVAASMAGGLRPVRNPSSSVVQDEVGGEVVVRRVEERRGGGGVPIPQRSRDLTRDWIRWPATKDVPAARGWWVSGASMGGEWGMVITRLQPWLHTSRVFTPAALHAHKTPAPAPPTT
jgi:hypothetical protein